jgi:predicted nucleic acid-binding Zn ribbon protein
LLAEAQRLWPDVAGPAIAAEAWPQSERGGVLTIACASAVWANELDLMGPVLMERLNEALGRTPFPPFCRSFSPAKGAVPTVHCAIVLSTNF